MPRVHVLVPVKTLDRAKSRLDLAPHDRADLVLAMVADTLGAALTVPDTSAIVVTDDVRVGALAASLGAVTLPEPDRPSGVRHDPLDAAYRAAAAHAREADPRTTLVALQGDLPALRGHELAAAVDLARTVGRVVVADHTGTGTTALVETRPGRPLDPRFGPGSCARHRASGAFEAIDAWPGLRTDVDTRTDLDRAIEIGVGIATRRVRAIAMPLTSRRTASTPPESDDRHR